VIEDIRSGWNNGKQCVMTPLNVWNELKHVSYVCSNLSLLLLFHFNLFYYQLFIFVVIVFI